IICTRINNTDNSKKYNSEYKYFLIQQKKGVPKIIMGQVKKKKRTIITIIVIALILGGGAVGITACNKNLSQLQDFSDNAVEIAKIEYHDISNHINVSGNVESENLIKITSKLTAKVATLNVELGSHVNEGDVLCVFDSSELQQQYDNLLKTQENSQNQSENTHKINERNLANAKRDKEINLAQAQRAINDAINAQNKAYEKESNLIDEINNEIVRRDEAKNTMNTTDDPQKYAEASQTYQEAEMNVQTKQSSLEAIREQFSTYDSAVQSAQDAYAAAERSADMTIQNYQDILDAEQFQQDNNSKTELEKLADSIAECTVKAPKSGVITSLNIAEGSIPTTDALMTIEDTDSLKIKVQISEADILNIQEGMPAIVKTSATGDKEFNATVSRVVNIYDTSAQGASATGTATGGYSAEITVDDSESELLIGMNAKVKIVLNEKKDVLAVPYDSIITDEDEKSHVLLAVKGTDGVTKAKSVIVEKGMEGTYYTEITSSEIKEGDMIVMNPNNYQDGDVLPISDIDTAVQGNGADSDA
ncbi:MAG: efflux RND transporter periplasmic adaptor subunit, partial [Oscillospiraceae bacterium]|nr:efflux RND transporter periplasmic adaptor subunit [Oscillospiraceae bacterium]